MAAQSTPHERQQPAQQDISARWASDGPSIGERVDCLDSFFSHQVGEESQEWRTGSVVETRGPPPPEIKVHFDGFSQGYDKWIEWSREADRFAPLGTRTMNGAAAAQRTSVPLSASLKSSSPRPSLSIGNGNVADSPSENGRVANGSAHSLSRSPFRGGNDSQERHSHRSMSMVSRSGEIDRSGGVVVDGGRNSSNSSRRMRGIFSRNSKKREPKTGRSVVSAIKNFMSLQQVGVGGVAPAPVSADRRQLEVKEEQQQQQRRRASPSPFPATPPPPYLPLGIARATNDVGNRGSEDGRGHSAQNSGDLTAFYSSPTECNGQTTAGAEEKWSERYHASPPPPYVAPPPMDESAPPSANSYPFLHPDGVVHTPPAGRRGQELGLHGQEEEKSSSNGGLRESGAYMDRGEEVAPRRSSAQELLGSHGSATSSITAVEVSKEFYDNDEYCEVEPPAPPIPELEDIRPSSPSIGRVDDDDATNGYPRDHGCGDSNGGSVEPTAPPMVDEEAKVAAEVAAEVAAVAAAFEAAAETPSTRELTPHLLEADASNANAYSLTVFRQNKQDHRPRSIICGVFESERAALRAAEAFSSPKWLDAKPNSKCMKCKQGFSTVWGRRRHHCRNCGRLVCTMCSALWPASMVPYTYRVDSSDKIIKVCRTCFETGRDFRNALLEGSHDAAMAAYNTGLVNLRVPYVSYGELPVHCAAAGGNVRLLSWLLEDRCCPLFRNGLKEDALVDKHKRTVMLAAADSGQVEVMQYLAVTEPTLVEGVDDMGTLRKAIDACLRHDKDGAPSKVNCYAGHEGQWILNATGQERADPLFGRSKAESGSSGDVEDAWLREISDSGYKDAEDGHAAGEEMELSYSAYDLSADVDDSSGAQLAAAGGKNACIVCFVRKVDCTLVPCGHHCCCIGCAGQTPTCPVCLKRVTQRIKAITA